MSIPTLETVRVLSRELTPRTGSHSNYQWNIELTTRHVKDRRGVVHNLVEREQAEVDRHDLDDRPHSAQCRTDSGADESRLRERCVADALGAELFQQSLAHRVATAIAAYILAHQEHARV